MKYTRRTGAAFIAIALFFPMVLKPAVPLPESGSLEPLPCRIVQEDAMAVPDSAGTVFGMATTHAPCGGIIVWRQSVTGGPVTVVLAPGPEEAYVGGSFIVGGGGYLYLTATNNTGTRINYWRIPGYMP